MTNQQYMVMIFALEMLVKNDTEGYYDNYGKFHAGYTDINMEYELYGGYTKSLISNWTNNHPVKRSTLNSIISDCIIDIAISEKYITIPKCKGFAEYKEEVIKLTAKGQRHLLKALENLK